ncbi:MAG: hypothetical protein V4451_03400, partial [Pseudomonadota bacterium]
MDSGFALHNQAGSRPGGRGTFLCFAKEQVPKRKATRRLGPFGQPALLDSGGSPNKLACGSNKFGLTFRL